MLMYCDLWWQYIKVGKLFKGGNYSRKYGMYIFFSFSGKEGIYLEDHVADNVVDDRFSFRSNDPNNYSPSFYHFRPSKTSVSRPGGSIRKESRSDSPFYKAGNSYTGKKMGSLLLFLIHTAGNFDNKSFLKSSQKPFYSLFTAFLSKINYNQIWL